MKKYNGEKAIISLTSWKARINTVGLTLYSLYKQCPGFHIVLVLSEEEFPKKEAELPDTVMAFVEQDLIEILWVYKNYKSFKKILFTMDKYKYLPVISADDDCIYTRNYAEELYQAYKINNCVIRYPKSTVPHHYVAGPYTIYPTWDHFGAYLKKYMDCNIDKLNLCADDDYYNVVIKENHIKAKTLNKTELPCYFFSQQYAIHKNLV